MNSYFNQELDAGLMRRALEAVGELLAADGERLAIILTGGATLNLLGIIERTTSDIDVIARASRGEDGSFRMEEAEPFPAALDGAVATVARDLGLPRDWMNGMVGEQWRHGFPPFMVEEIEWTNYGGGLDVGLVGRRTLVAFKLFASVDQGPESVHFRDLVLLEPGDDELIESRDWVIGQESHSGWPNMVDRVVERVRRTD